MSKGWRVIGTIVVILALLGIVAWMFSYARRNRK